MLLRDALTPRPPPSAPACMHRAVTHACRKVVPALHRRYIESMVTMFGESAERCTTALRPAAESGAAADMENYYSRLGLDIIGKAVFNYDFDSLSKDDPVIRAVYTALRETEHRSLVPVPYWKLPFATELIPRQVRARDSARESSRLTPDAAGVLPVGSRVAVKPEMNQIACGA